jgi:hypothetical protein
MGSVSSGKETFLILKNRRNVLKQGDDEYSTDSPPSPEIF